MDIKLRPKILTPPPILQISIKTPAGPKITIFLLLIIPLSLIGLFPDAQAQTVTANVTGDPFTIGEGNSTLGVYTAIGSLINTDGSIFERQVTGPTNYNVDSSERLTINSTVSTTERYLLIDLDTTLSELQQTISPGGVFYSQFNHNVTSLTTQNGTTNIYLAVFDGDVVTNSRIGAGTTVLLVSNVDPQGERIFLDTNPLYSSLYDTTLANKNIGYIIQFNSPVTVVGEQPISLDFSSFRPDGTPINHITRTGDTTPEPEPQGQAQDTPTITGDPFTIGEGDSEVRIYFSSNNIVDTDNSIFQRTVARADYLVDSSERLILDFTVSGNLQYLVIDMNTTLGELQQTINPDGVFYNKFNHNFTGLVTQDGITNIYLAIFDDDVVDDQDRLDSGTVVPLVRNEDPQGERIFLDTNPPYSTLFNNTLANKNIGYIIEFNNPVSVPVGSHPISFDFNTFDGSGTPINHITRTIEPPPSAQEITLRNLVNVIAARQAAIDQQNVIVDYWSDSNNPFADDRELAQARIDHANNHIMQSTQQRDSYQAQLDRLTS